MRASETYQEWGKNYEKNQNTVTQKRCGYVASNRSRFSKHQMTRSPVFSVHFTNRKNPAKPDYHMSIKKSQAILKCFIDLWAKIAFGLRRAQKAKPCFVTLKTVFSLTAGQGVENIKWPAVPIFSLSSSGPIVNQTLFLRSMKHFRIACLLATYKSLR